MIGSPLMLAGSTRVGLAGLRPARLCALRTPSSRRLEVQAADQRPQKIWRPSLDDVQRISQGDAARHRGTGSRAVPHRLNADERKAYDLAKKGGVLTLSGSGYRRERKGAPLANIWRQWCDARATPCVLLAKGAGGTDAVLVDLSTLRQADVSAHRETCLAIAAQHGCTADAADQQQAQQSPFTVILPAPLVAALLESGGSDAAAAAAAAAAEGEDAAADGEDAAAAMPQSSMSGSVAEQLAELRGSAPIWQQPPMLECFAAERGVAKAMAKRLSEELRSLGTAATSA